MLGLSLFSNKKHIIDADSVRAAFLDARLVKRRISRFRNDKPKPDAKPNWAKAAVKAKKLHDEDFIVFSAFKNPNETILDIGSNWGYSAASIWGSGSTCRIISFDPIVGFKDCLEQIKTMKAEQFDYRTIGLGDQPGEIDFLVPVVNGRMLTALTTAQRRPHFPTLAKNIIGYDKSHDYLSVAQFYFFAFRAKIHRLDDVLKTDFPNDRIAAAKLDAEGYEPNILRGMRRTLETHIPMLLIENGALPVTQKFLMSLGYQIMERKEHYLIQCSRVPTAINFFYCHQSKIEEYRKSGLIKNENKAT